MSITLGRALAIISSLKSEVYRIYREAVSEYLTYDEILKRRNIRVLCSDGYQSLPRWGKAEIEGYADAFFSSQHGILWKENCDDRWVLDGKLYLRGEERDKAFKKRWDEVVYAGVFYKGTDKPLSLQKNGTDTVKP